MRRSATTPCCYPNVTVRERCAIGARVIVHSGAVIGSDGFGYVQRDGRHHKVPQLGTVVIEDDVELGANVAVDRATFGRTLVRRGDQGGQSRADRPQRRDRRAHA